MDLTTEIIRAQLANGVILHIQSTVAAGEQDVASGIPSFHGVIAAIEGIAQEVSTVLENVKPQKAHIEFGLEVTLEAGQLTALLVKGQGTANLKVSLEWEGPKANQA